MKVSTITNVCMEGGGKEWKQGVTLFKSLMTPCSWQQTLVNAVSIVTTVPLSVFVCAGGGGYHTIPKPCDPSLMAVSRFL